jgi:hypothetical protein
VTAKPDASLSADGKLAPASWPVAFLLAAIAVYSPVVVIGLLGFTRDPDCRVQWWGHLPLLPGMAAWTFLVFAHDLQVAGVPLRRFQAPWISTSWAQFSRSLQTAPHWVHLVLWAALTAVFLSAFAVLFRQFPQRSRAREVIFLSGLVFGSLLAGMAYAMFRA